ncbi:GerAB/ArcD/ProY family transporter [Paenibacillus chondroitinus]|uniref:GerAB/ArcD/ProY family transporter n=1 Tax=Paenibacillus chondroitinus TaxID=59842 RepID=A0ABU6DMT3_9BACL|nr:MULTISPECIES: GerAB/ArcD/ProY family transporter [Paenibacillus]MCY9660664.1 spore germination protein [Paenibacillus anseongense]MEB4798156.1 GerAB/ArcD/ProY family transporter [Paenibacillus chondroitinus]
MDKSFSVMLMYVLTHLGLIFFIYPEDIIGSTDSAQWIPITIGIIVHFFVISIYMKGLSFFPKWDIIRIYLSAGKTVALIFLLPVTLYFFIIAILAVRAYSEIICIIFLSNTPLWSIMILLLFVSTYLASKGIEAIFRTGVLLGIIFLPLIFMISFTSFQNINWYYAFPLFDKDFSFLMKPSYLKSFFAFAGGFLFIGFVQPIVAYQRKKILLAAAILIPFFIFSVYIPILTFGEATAVTLHFPFVVVVETINISWFMFDRVTMFFLLTLITFSMLFISLTLWQANRIVSKCMPIIKPVYLLLAISVAIFVSCLMIPDWNSVGNLFLWNTPLRFFVLVTVPLSIYFLGLRFKRKVGHELN